MLCEWLGKGWDCDLYILQESFSKMEELNGENSSIYFEKLLYTTQLQIVTWKFWDSNSIQVEPREWGLYWHKTSTRKFLERY